MEEKQIFSENLRYYIHKSGKTQAIVAEAIGVSRGTFSDWINGKVYPRMHKVERLAEYLGVRKSDLVEAHSDDNGYYHDKQTAELAQQLNESPEIRSLLLLAKDLSKEDTQLIKCIIERIR